MRLTARRLNRATSARQMLLDRHALPVVDAVRRLVALQAQEPASPYLALWNRLRDLRPDALTVAFRAYGVVKAILMRFTLHAVAADDRAAFHRAMTPTLRAAGLHDRRFVAAVALLAWRYLTAFGPASRQDFAQFALLRQSEVGPAFDALAGRLVMREGPGGATLYDVADAPLPEEDAPAPPRLLGMWDNVLLAYKDRARVIPPAVRPRVIRRNGDVLPTVLVDGHVAGVWRIVGDAVEVAAFEELADDAWDGIEREARSLLALVEGRDDDVYGRYGHWWSKLEGAQVRSVAVGVTRSAHHAARSARRRA